MKKYSSDLVANFLREHIGDVEFSDAGIFLMSYSQEQAAVLRPLIDGGFISRKSLTAFVHMMMVDAGRRMFKDKASKGVSVDHLFSPSVFGFAIDHGAFIESQLGKVDFDGKTVEYYRELSRGLLEKIVEQFLHPPELKSSAAEGD